MAAGCAVALRRAARSPSLADRSHDAAAVSLAVARARLFAVRPTRRTLDYPVTLSQLRDGLIGERADEPTLARCYLTSDLLQATVECAEGYYFPRGRSDLLETRRRRERTSRQLLENSARALAFVRKMPFVRMVALSGSLAHMNAEGGADLDLFVVTRPARVWSVMVTALVVARLMGWRRQLCLNYIVSERAPRGPGRPVLRQSDRASPAARWPRGTAHSSNRTASSSASIPTSGRRRCFRRTAATAALPSCRDCPGLDDRAALRTALPHVRPIPAAVRTPGARDQVRLEAECLKLHTSSHYAR